MYIYFGLNPPPPPPKKKNWDKFCGRKWEKGKKIGKKRDEEEKK